MRDGTFEKRDKGHIKKYKTGDSTEYFPPGIKHRGNMTPQVRVK